MTSEHTILRKWGNSVATAKFRGLAQNFAARRKLLAWTHIILPSVGEQTFLWDMPLRSNCRKLGFLKRKNWMAHFHDDIIAIVSENNRPAAVYFPVLPREKWVFWWREALYKWRHYSLNKWLTNSLFDSFISLFIDWLAFSALTLLVGHREERSACKKLWWGVGVVICAHCLHMVQLMPLHSTIPSPLVSLKSRLVLPFWYWLTQVVLEKRLINGCSVVVVVIDWVIDWLIDVLVD